jgi:hypothetical protein
MCRQTNSNKYVLFYSVFQPVNFIEKYHEKALLSPNEDSRALFIDLLKKSVKTACN